MGKVSISGVGGAGAGSDECTATRAELLKGYAAITSDSDDEVVEGILELTGDASDSQVLDKKTYYNKDAKIKRTGTMQNIGAVSLSLNAGGSYNIPSGYHNGSGKITASSLVSQTVGTASAGHILNGQTAWVNGDKVTGNIASMGGQIVYPGASLQTVATANKFLTANVIVNPVSNLYAGNIREGVNVGGVVGNMKDYSYLAVGQTSF